jgi:hypothetical protein
VLAEAIAAVKTGDLARLHASYPDNPLAIVGDVARGALCAAPGHELVDADFSGIEARVTAWLAGEQSALVQWAKFDETGLPEDEPYHIDGKAAGLDRDEGKVFNLAFGFAGGPGAFRKFAPDDPATEKRSIPTRIRGAKITRTRAGFGPALNTPRSKPCSGPVRSSRSTISCHSSARAISFACSCRAGARLPTRFRI